MQLNHLRYFVFAVQMKSLNRAARTLEVSPQTLCAGVLSLEKELGYPLLNRSKAGVSPTANGEIVYADALKMVEAENHWLQLREHASRVSVSLAANTTMMRWIVPKALLRLRKTNPELDVVLHESYVESVFRTIVDRRLVGLITCVNERVEKLYQGRIVQNDMQAMDMGEDPCVVVVNRTNPLAAQPSLRLEQLKKLSLAWNPFRQRNFIYRDICKYFADGEPLQIPEQENLLRMISIQNDVASILPTSGLRAQGSLIAGLTALEVEDFPMPGRIWLIHPRKPTSVEKIVLGALQTVFLEEKPVQEHPVSQN